MSSHNDRFVILDIESGMYFSAQNACVIDTTKLSQEQLEILNAGTNTQKALLADELGVAISFAAD
jgi:hypothetical protein